MRARFLGCAHAWLIVVNLTNRSRFNGGVLIFSFLLEIMEQRKHSNSSRNHWWEHDILQSSSTILEPRDHESVHYWLNLRPNLGPVRIFYQVACCKLSTCNTQPDNMCAKSILIHISNVFNNFMQSDEAKLAQLGANLGPTCANLAQLAAQLRANAYILSSYMLQVYNLQHATW